MLRANATRLTGLAGAIERVRDRDRFYAETGRSDFRRREIIAGPMLAIEGLELCHRGHDALPFVTVPRLVLRRGDRLHVSGPSGCGKSSLLKAVAGLWPYGEGRVAVAAGARMFLAAQEPDLPERLTLRELVTYPHRPGTSTRWRSPRCCRAPASAASSASSTTSCTRGGRGATCFPAGRSSGWCSRGCCCRSPTSCFSTRPPRPSIRRPPPTSTSRWPSACPAAVILSVLHSDTVPADSFGKPFYNRTLEVGPRLELVSGFAEAGSIAHPNRGPPPAARDTGPVARIRKGVASGLPRTRRSGYRCERVTRAGRR